MDGKRKREVDEEDDEDDEKKPVCKYGKDCYRRNPLHLQAYTHPGTFFLFYQLQEQLF